MSGVKLLDADLQRWTAARALACAAPIEQRAPALACLDGVLAQQPAPREVIVVADSVKQALKLAAAEEWSAAAIKSTGVHPTI